MCEGLDRLFFGGINETPIPDNTDAMILDADALATTLVPPTALYEVPPYIDKAKGAPRSPHPRRAGTLLRADQLVAE